MRRHNRIATFLLFIIGVAGWGGLFAGMLIMQYTQNTKIETVRLSLGNAEHNCKIALDMLNKITDAHTTRLDTIETSISGQDNERAEVLHRLLLVENELNKSTPLPGTHDEVKIVVQPYNPPFDISKIRLDVDKLQTQVNHLGCSKADADLYDILFKRVDDLEEWTQKVVPWLNTRFHIRKQYCVKGK